MPLSHGYRCAVVLEGKNLISILANSTPSYKAWTGALSTRRRIFLPFNLIIALS
jgi:hypothetical protein